MKSTLKKTSIWRCTNCGKIATKWSGMCPDCKQWNTFVEEEKQVKNPQVSLSKKAVAIHTIAQKDIDRMEGSFPEFDRLLGGGVVPGALVLLGGPPGIGKSTLLLQVAHTYAEKGHKVLYVSGEESMEQVSLRARRINALSPNLFVLSSTSYHAVEKAVDELNPDFLCIDSIQILYKEEVPSSPGSIVQVKELAHAFMLLAKKRAMATFLIGHVTKTGDLAGPRLLEHLVDTVLEFEGDKNQGFRLLRSIKNRFGSTDDLAMFQMRETGLYEVENPSKLFLEERRALCHGSSVTAAIEGGRAFLVEVQALVTKSFLPSPSRKSSGIDQNRLSLLLAVLEKRLGYKMHASDVFVSLIGGIKVREPAVDLAVLCALSSSFLQKPLQASTLFLGEVGLSGEIRSSPRMEARLNEGKNMGYTQEKIPEKNRKN